MCFRCNFFLNHHGLLCNSSVWSSYFVIFFNCFWLFSLLPSHMAMHVSCLLLAFLLSAPSWQNPPTAALPVTDHHVLLWRASVSFFSFPKTWLTHEPKDKRNECVCSPEGFSTAHRHEHLKWISSLKLDALFLGCWSKKKEKKKETKRHNFIQTCSTAGDFIFLFKVFRMDVLCKSKVTF